MEESIKKQFEEKNYEIFINKLKTDLNNNSDSLNRTVENTIDLHLNKLEKKLELIFKSQSIDYDKVNFSNDFVLEKPILKELLLSSVKNRKEDIEFFLNNASYEAKFINKYYEAIDNSKKNFDNKTKSKVNEEVLINFANKIMSSCKFKTEEAKKEISTSIIINLQQPLVEGALDNNELRNNNLKNYAKDSLNYFIEMNKATVDNYSDEAEVKEKKKNIDNIA